MLLTVIDFCYTRDEKIKNQYFSTSPWTTNGQKPLNFFSFLIFLCSDCWDLIKWECFQVKKYLYAGRQSVRECHKFDNCFYSMQEKSHCNQKTYCIEICQCLLYNTRHSSTQSSKIKLLQRSVLKILRERSLWNLLISRFQSSRGEFFFFNFAINN